MKWVVIGLGIGAAVAAGRWARTRPNVQALLVFAIGLLPFTALVERVSLNLLSHETYRGDARGFEVTVVDLVALTLFVALPNGRWPMPFKRLALLWLSVCTASIAIAWVPLYAGFGVWRIARVVFLALVVARACEDRRAPPILLQGFAWGVVLQLVYALFQRYVEGFYQVRGTFAHQNSLGMSVDLVAPVFLALLLGKGTKKWLLGVALAAGIVCVVFTLSRGALVMLPAGLAIAYVGSLVRNPTATKIRIGILALVAVVAIGIKSFDSIVDRFEHAPEASALGREKFEEAAGMISHDHPLGVGINNFSHVLADHYGARVDLPEYDRTGIVHNVYWLTIAEMGWVGLFAYLALVLYPIVVGLRWLWRYRSDARTDVILGITAGLIVTAVQGVLEWLARQTEMSYLVWTQMAMLLALVRQLREEHLGVSPPPRKGRA